MAAPKKPLQKKRFRRHPKPPTRRPPSHR
jgi:hypothetical protein